MQFPKMVHPTLLTPRGLWDFRVGHRCSLCFLKSVSIPQPWSSGSGPFFSLKSYIKPKSFTTGGSRCHWHWWFLISGTLWAGKYFRPAFMTFLHIHLYLRLFPQLGDNSLVVGESICLEFLISGPSRTSLSFLPHSSPRHQHTWIIG